MDKKNLVNANDITNNKELPIPEELTKVNGKILPFHQTIGNQWMQEKA